ncbi:acyltransferase [Rhizobium leguminosarum]|nr:acyltransferase [Rhizobium leguminosarum]MBY5676349.1 acyltransferase [Rhizobium leguminosarum]MBY5716736.1 acyltransferase [Rhizobium leguminosarum]
MQKKKITKLRTFIHKYFIVHAMRQYYKKVHGMDIGENSRISLSVKLDKTNPKGVHVGKHTALAFEVAVLTHDFINGKHVDTYIGDYCFIGARAIIMPGRRVGNHCIIGPGAVVMKDVPDGSVVIGNPSTVVERGIKTAAWGKRLQSVA